MDFGNSKGKTIVLKSLLLGSVLFIFSCTGYNYVNNAPVTPFFKEKHTYQATANLSLHHLEANIAVTPIKYLGLTASYFTPWSDVVGITKGTRSFEVSPLVWFPIYKKDEDKVSLFTDLQIGYGTGQTNSSENLDYFTSHNDAIGQSKWKKIFIQPSLYLHIPGSGNFSHVIGLGTKLNFIKFDNLSYTQNNASGSEYPYQTTYNYEASHINNGSIMELFSNYALKFKFLQFNIQTYWAYKTYFPGTLNTTKVDVINYYGQTTPITTEMTNQTSSIVFYDHFRANFSITFYLKEGLKKRGYYDED
jgi:hypothetical protein